MPDTNALTVARETVDSVVIRFAGDSGDGMQLTGTQFTTTSALAGNDLATFPDYPAEIRAPAGTLPGVSGFQVHFSSQDVFTPGDVVDVLVAMNPAALKRNLGDVRKGGTVILDTAGFTKKNLDKAQYDLDPRKSGDLEGFDLIEVDITELTLKSVEDMKMNNREAVRSKNMFALGLVYWMFDRTIDHTLDFLTKKFKTKPVILEANLRALKAGYHYGETQQLFRHVYEVKAAEYAPGLYRNISGNEALAFGLCAAAELADIELFYASYPITPASPILHYLARQKALGVRTFQAEDEIAAMCAAIGASYAGALGVTATSGPGVALKAEAIGLGLIYELPAVIVNVQRAGPSTGMPTKTEQADLLQALYGRHGESPMPVIAAKSPGDCFFAAIEAARVALKFMTPVILLSDGYIANGAEPWPIPNVSDIPSFPVSFRTEPDGYQPYLRNENYARPWALPGTKGLEHRLGGLEKQEITGNVSYDPANHQRMSEIRRDKVLKVADDLPPTEIFGDPKGDLVVVGWGGTYGAIHQGVARARERGHEIGHVHLRWLSPLPNDLGDILRRYQRVLVPELNLGQLSKVLRAEYLVDARSYCKIQGQPFRVSEIEDAIRAQLEAN
jgi:2-oxoglutarate ferredoxin oxidoreductase subunit alpha